MHFTNSRQHASASGKGGRARFTTPALFVGHGNPMNALEDNRFSRTWDLLGKSLRKPSAVLCISAHWETWGTRVTAMERPPTLHDFGGFPRALFEVQYPARGEPRLARRIRALVTTTRVELDNGWGLDHGAWSVLKRMFPEADVPVVQLSLNRNLTPRMHYEIGRELKPLREEGVLVLGSGNIVHNLHPFRFDSEDPAHCRAAEFDETIKRCLLAGDHARILSFESLGPLARFAMPTREHFLPLIYIAALQEEDERITFPVDGIIGGSVSMRSVLIN